MRVAEKKRIFARNDLSDLLNNKHSCVLLKRCKRKIRLRPKYLREVKAGIKEALDKCLFKFDHSVNGFLLDYRNFNIVPDKCNGTIVGRHGEFLVLVSAAFFVFQPEIGSQLEGVVNARSDSHVGCLVHKCFNAMILKPEHIEPEEWNCKNIQIGDKIVFEVVEHALFGQVPYIQGKLPDEHVQKSGEMTHKKSENVDITVNFTNPRQEESSESELSDDSENVIPEFNEVNSPELNCTTEEPARKKLPHRVIDLLHSAKVDNISEPLRALSSTVLTPGESNESMFVDNFSPINRNESPQAKKRKKEKIADVTGEHITDSGKESTVPKGKKRKVDVNDIKDSPMKDASALEKNEVSSLKKNKKLDLNRSSPAKHNSSSDLVNSLLNVNLVDIISECKGSPEKSDGVESSKHASKKKVNINKNGRLSNSPKDKTGKTRQRKESFTEKTAGNESNPKDDSHSGTKIAVDECEKTSKFSKPKDDILPCSSADAPSPKKSQSKSKKKNADAVDLGDEYMSKADLQKHKMSEGEEMCNAVKKTVDSRLTSPNNRKRKEAKKKKDWSKAAEDKGDETNEGKSGDVDYDEDRINFLGSPRKEKEEKGAAELKSRKASSRDHSSHKVTASDFVSSELATEKISRKETYKSKDSTLEPVVNNVPSTVTALNNIDASSGKTEEKLEKSVSAGNKKERKRRKSRSEMSKEKSKKSSDEAESSLKGSLIQKLLKSLEVKDGVEAEKPAKGSDPKTLKKGAPASQSGDTEVNSVKEKKRKRKRKSEEAMDDKERSLMIDALLNEAKECLGIDDVIEDAKSKSKDSEKKKEKSAAKKNSSRKTSKAATNSGGRLGSADSGFNSLLDKQNE